MNKLAVVALGGNALLRSGQQGTYQEQMQNIASTCEQLIPLIEQGYQIVIGHGNGPQVGNALLRHDAGLKNADIPNMPLDFCVSETQGSIGYMIELQLRNTLRQRGIAKKIVTIVTQVLVHADDPAFENPTKPVGPYYTKAQADNLTQTNGWSFTEDARKRGWRRLVSSPKPQDINGWEWAEKFAREGNIVITVGGGGIPVCEQADGTFKGVEAVIDKDAACSLLATKIKADELYILTDIPKAYLNFGKSNEKALDSITPTEANQYVAEGHFAAGSMGPKMKAAIRFVENGGQQAIITEAGQLQEKEAGTRIVM